MSKTNTSSNESPSPGGDHIPRLPGTRRDFGKLPKELRSEKGARSNLLRAEKDDEPQGMLPSRERSGRTLLSPEPEKPNHRAVRKRMESLRAKATNK